VGGRKPGNHWTLPASPVSTVKQVGDFSDTWISQDTASALGLRSRPYDALVLATRPVTNDDLARLSVYGISAWSGGSQTEQLKWVRLGVVGGAGLLTALVVGIAVALAAAEGRSDVATFAAVGAGPLRRRSLGAMHGVFLGVVGALLGLAIAIPSGLSLTQVDGLPGVAVPWLTVAGTLVVVPLLAALAGWLVTPTRLSLVRRAS
jgi:putative ABC transport system permease protein